MFTKDALETLTQAEAISAANAALTQTVAPTNGEAAIALPESFKVHDNCHCFPETAYATGFQDATRQAKEFHALYHEATAGVGGSKAQLNAFRRALAAQRA